MTFGVNLTQITFIEHVYRVNLKVQRNITLHYTGTFILRHDQRQNYKRGNTEKDVSMLWSSAEGANQGWNKNLQRAHSGFSCLVCFYPDEGNSIGDAGFNPLRVNVTVSPVRPVSPL